MSGLVELNLKNGKIVHIGISCHNSRMIYYKKYFIDWRSFCEKSDISMFLKSIKGNNYVNTMTDILDMLDNGTLFAFIMNNSYDDFIHYVVNIPESNSHLTSFGDYFIVNTIDSNYETFEFIVIDGTNPEYQLKIYCEYDEFVRLEFNSNSFEFYVLADENNEYDNSPIKNYLMNVGKSARNK